MILKSNDLNSFNEDYLTLQIACLFEGFKGSSIEPCLWVQKDNDFLGAIILGYGQTAFVSYFGGDENELLEFLSVLSFKNIITNKAFPFLNTLKEDFVFKKTLDKTALPLPKIESLNKIYETLLFGKSEDVSLPEFEVFAPDTSHLLRHGFAFSLTEEFGGVFVHFKDGSGILKGISVKEGFRKKGFGTFLLNKTIKYCPKGLYAATSKSENFYLKNGFIKEPYKIYFGELK